MVTVDRRQPPKKTGRTFLVVVDDTEEMRAALRYACRRARHTGGRVALLRVVEPAELKHIAAISDLMTDESRKLAEALLQRMASEVYKTSGEVPALYVREGQPRDELLKLINEEPSISILVLAAGVGPEGPGPLVAALTGRYVNRLRIPVTIIPGTLTDTAIDELT
jgi:nucleotide-binding universal stress UspA family protein